ncbi:hypothetical protein SSX86_009535 [Deinandra increscens subsp. villosa]|uniref:MADS-box domain-containing protein n=1 Tax=Deinandra increscens subsp. villosa TaxID=3103831 RepID=A0AAP0DE80_9ASTR
MGRAKLRMELIPKEKTRNTTYVKRKHGIIKKANEFAILCDVDTIIIIYPPNSNSPEIWPENPDKITKTIACYKSKKGETGKRTYDLTDILKDRNRKIEDELVKARKRNMEAKYATWFDELNTCKEAELREFAMWLEDRENVVRGQLEFKKRDMNVQMPYMGSGFDYGQVVNHCVMSHDQLGWFGDAGSSGIPLGFGYPAQDSGNVQWGYQAQDSGNVQWGYQAQDSGNVQWGYQAQDSGNVQWGYQPYQAQDSGNVEWGYQAQDSVMQEFGKQENESEVSNGGVGDFVMDRFYDY